MPMPTPVPTAMNARSSTAARLALGERGEVDVVVERDRDAERVGELAAQRRAGEPGRARDQAREAVAVGDPRHADRGGRDRLAGGELARDVATRSASTSPGGRHGLRGAREQPGSVPECDTEVRGTEVHPEHGRHAAYPRLRMTVIADSLAAGYRALTEACGLVDRSERGKLALIGPDAKTFLHGQVTNDIEGLEPGRGCYAAFLTHKGKMLGDMRVLDLGDELLLDTERATLQELFNMIRRFKLGSDVELHKRTLEMGLLSLIGPDARRVAGVRSLSGPEHANARAEIDGTPVILAVTDTGVDVFCGADDTAAVRAALEAAGAVLVDEAIAEIVRVERGRPRYGFELNDGVIPQEAGLNERAVSFTKGCYVGQETVARLFYRGKPNRHLRGLRLSGRGGDRRRAAAAARRRSAASARPSLSPTFGPIALAIVRREAEPGETLAVGDAGATAEVVELPFEDPPLTA